MLNGRYENLVQLDSLDEVKFIYITHTEVLEDCDKDEILTIAAATLQCFIDGQSIGNQWTIYLYIYIYIYSTYIYILQHKYIYGERYRD